MAVAEITNLIIEKGTDFEVTFNVFNESNALLDINESFSGVAKLRKYPTSPIEYEFNVSLNEELDKIILSMSAEDTEQLPSGRCYFDVIITYGYAETTTKKIIKGTIIVSDTASL